MKVIGAKAPLVLCKFTGILLSEAVNHMLTAGAYFSQYPYLTQSFTILNIENISLNLFIMQLHFGIKIVLNLITVLSILASLYVYKKL